jgi:ArsR family transcriptional regulator
MMKVCFPVFQNHGLSSPVASDYDSAPLCVIVDNATGSLLEVANRPAPERHGLCRELAKYGGNSEAAFVVDGIGAGALSELGRAGFKVFQAVPGNVADNLERVARQELTELTGRPGVPTATLPSDADDDDLPRFGCGF